MRILKMTLLIIAIIAIAGYALLYFSTDNLRQFGKQPSGERLARILQSPNYDGNKFVNQYGVTLSFTISEYFTVFKEFVFGDNRSPQVEIPVNALSREDFADSTPDDLVFTWLVHSTVLIEMDSQTILTDPVWSDKVSPSTIYGPERFHPMPIALEDLPEIDAIIISHDHYDHLDMKTIEHFAQTGTKFVTVLGVGAHLEKWGVAADRIIELDWWEEFHLTGEFKLVCTPSQHFSGRGIIDGRNSSFWSTWAVIGPKHRLFFCGDTGEIPEFKEIGEKFGPFDLTLMKIGAYGEMWPDIHLTPEQAVRLHQIVSGRVFLPIHWGSFDLALHSWAEPIEDLARIGAENDIDLVTLYPGQRINIDSLPPVNHWWNTGN